MNFYRFIDSADVRGYLEEQQYEFSPLEAAFVVWQSRVATLEEKHAAWSEIIETMPDTDIPYEKWKAPRESLHAFLRDYMALEDRLLREFYDPAGFFAYNYYEPEYYAKPENCDLLVDHRGIYHTLDACLKDARSALQEQGAQEIVVYRIDLAYGRRIHAAFDSAGNVLRVRPEYELFVTEEAILRDSFVTLTGELLFPVPFCKGDLLYDPVFDECFTYEGDGTTAGAGATSFEYCPEEKIEFVRQTVREKSCRLKNKVPVDRLYKNETGEKNALVLLMAKSSLESGFPFRFSPPDIALQPRSSDGFYGISQLDRNSIGSFTSDLIGLASFGGAAAQAKDDFLLRTVLHHALDRDETVVFFSLQMKVVEVWRRLLALLSGCDPTLADGFSPDELDRLWNAYFMLLRARLTVIDSPETDAEVLKYRLKNERPDFIAVDDLQRFNPIPELEEQRERVQYAHIVYSLKQLAKEYNIPILLTAGLPWPQGFTPGQQPKPALRDFDRLVGNADFDQILLVHAERGKEIAEVSFVKNRYDDCVTANCSYNLPNKSK